MRPGAAAAAGFVVLFALAHVVASAQDETLCSKGYFSTLTVWTLLFTAFVAACPCPPAVVAAALGVNALVCALYYGMVNQQVISGTSFMLHGGCSLVLLALVAVGALDCAAQPMAAAAVAASFLVANALMQCWKEKQTKQLLYPSCERFGHPAWRLVLVPLIGAAAAAAATA